MHFKYQVNTANSNLCKWSNDLKVIMGQTINTFYFIYLIVLLFTSYFISAKNLGNDSEFPEVKKKQFIVN